MRKHWKEAAPRVATIEDIEIIGPAEAGRQQYSEGRAFIEKFLSVYCFRNFHL
ncbi:MAG: hypothetical protein P8X90_06850 [Desulfobacterales bacterium]